VRLVQQFQRAMVTARSIHAGIDGRMVGQIFAIINRRAFDLIDCSVDFVNGALFFVVNPVGRREPVEVSPRVTQISERVQVSGMSSGFIRPRSERCTGQSETSIQHNVVRSSCSPLAPFGRKSAFQRKPGTAGFDSENHKQILRPSRSYAGTVTREPATGSG
jgi:hypothetical protein